MSEKNINSRIQHKHDIEANWEKATNFIPKAGEIIIYDADDNNLRSRIKIGNGIDNVNNLNFIEAFSDSNVQADWAQFDETQLDYIKNKPVEMTQEDALNILCESGALEFTTDENGAVLTDENGAILVI